jgi:hypothetical protein
VGAMRRQAESGALIGSALFFFTDNAVAELAIYKGSANSPKLHALLVELRLLQAKYGFRLIVCHCAGTRMIAQGTDGVSRGQLDEGVMNGTDMMSIIPLHLNAMKRSRDVEAWIKTWLGEEAWIKTWLGKDAETLEPKDWFERGHNFAGGMVGPDVFWRPKLKAGKFIWVPPPASALPAWCHHNLPKMLCRLSA